jgi:hypothetical protein
LASNSRASDRESRGAVVHSLPSFVPTGVELLCGDQTFFELNLKFAHVRVATAHNNRQKSVVMDFERLTKIERAGNGKTQPKSQLSLFSSRTVSAINSALSPVQFPQICDNEASTI